MFCYLCSWCVYSLTLTLARAPLLLHPTLRTFPWDHLLPHLKYFPLNLLWLQVLLPALVCAEVSLLHSQNSGFSLSRPAQGGVAVSSPRSHGCCFGVGPWSNAAFFSCLYDCVTALSVSRDSQIFVRFYFSICVDLCWPTSPPVPGILPVDLSTESLT